MDESNSKAYYIAGSVGVVLCIGNLITGNSDIFGQSGYILSIVASGAMGYFFSHRPWRWPVVLFLTQFVVHSIFKGEIGNLWPISLIIIAIIALPGIMLSIFAGWLNRKLY